MDSEICKDCEGTGEVLLKGVGYIHSIKCSPCRGTGLAKEVLETYDRMRPAPKYKLNHLGMVTQCHS